MAGGLYDRMVAKYEAEDLASAERQIDEYMQKFNITRGEAIVMLDDYDRAIIDRQPPVTED